MARWCLGWPAARRDDDDKELTWQSELRPHATGEFSMAAAQANTEMEDQAQVMSSPDATLVGVYDGHGGPDASRLFPILHELAGEHGGEVDAEVMRRAFMAADEEYLQLLRWSLPNNMSRAAASGSCCLLGAISGDTLLVANAGDSRAVLARRRRNGAAVSVIAERLSADHSLSSEKLRRELAALHAGGNDVIVHARGAWRVKGSIRVSRSIGDAHLKSSSSSSPVITAEPSIQAVKLINSGDGDEMFVVFASDGLWEHVSEEEAVRVVATSTTRRGAAARLVRAAIDAAARRREVRPGDMRRIKRGVRRHFHDDVTVVVVFLDGDGGGGRGKRRRRKVVDCSSSGSGGGSCSNTPLNVYGFSGSGD
uniref:protein-serine/threonine phosphatase n=1 Tax=Leersia perrieri TaxID=77586 RepID=A0A0D9WUT8_9ORYZ